MPNRDDFFDELGRIFEESRKNNAQFVEVRSGDLHKNLGGYPGHNHQMPTCCDIMKQVMGKNDAILKQPAKGRGANLIIRYQLPRKLSKTHNSIIQIESPKNNQFPQKNTKIEKINAIIDIDSSQKSRSSGSTIKNDDNIAKKLFENRIDTLLLKSKDFAPLKEICALMEIDPISALVKIRSIAEKISRKICDNSNIDTKNLIFSQLRLLHKYNH
jgi:5-methylcytosine-specific restriction protein A